MSDFAAIFGALPPEINSGRMYSGPGAGPLIAAAAAWDAVAAQLWDTAAGFGSAVSELTQRWLGPASAAMAAAAGPYLAWLHSSATAAEQTAAQAKAAAAAYELAFTMTVPPPVIAANRSLLLALVATNIFGQNAPAIAATEAHYGQLWIQDATAMHTYAGSSVTASRLTPFPHPIAGHTVAPQTPTLADYLEHIPNVVNTVVSNSSAGTAWHGIAIQNARLAFQASQQAPTAPPAQPGPVLGIRVVSAGRPMISAATGRADVIGFLSVPPGWATATPEVSAKALTTPNLPTMVTTPMPTVTESMVSPAALTPLPRNGFGESRPRSKPVIVRSPAAG